MRFLRNCKSTIADNAEQIQPACRRHAEKMQTLPQPFLVASVAAPDHMGCGFSVLAE